MVKYRIKELHYTPSFRGVHDRRKTAAWLTLWDHRMGGDERLSLSQLAEESRVSYRSLATMLPRWERLDYVSRTGTRPGYQYRITVKGIRWLERRLEDSAKAINEILAEIEQTNDN